MFEERGNAGTAIVSTNAGRLQRAAPFKVSAFPNTNHHALASSLQGPGGPSSPAEGMRVGPSARQEGPEMCP